jgi:uncharacterized protein (DUF2267 family)
VKIVFENDKVDIEFKASEKTAIHTTRLVCEILAQRLDDEHASEAVTMLDAVIARYLTPPAQEQQQEAAV